MNTLKAPGVTTKIIPREQPVRMLDGDITVFLGYTVKTLEASSAVTSPLAIRNLSQYMTLFGNSKSSTCYMERAVRLFFQNGGRKCYIISLGSHDCRNVETGIGSYLGSDDGPAGRSGLKLLSNLRDSSVVVLPDLAIEVERGRMAPEGMLDIQLALVEYCEITSMLAVLDLPRDISLSHAQSWRARIDSRHAAIYHPWICGSKRQAVETRLIQTDRFTPPSGAVCGVLARVAIEKGVHHAPANIQLEQISDVASEFTLTESETFNSSGINCLRSWAGRGIYVWGARTAASDPSWQYLNVSRVFSLVARTIEQRMAWVAFEHNNQILWEKVNRQLDSFLTDLWRRGVFKGKTRAEGFFIKCDEENNPAEARDQGMLSIEIGLAVVHPAEFIIIQIQEKTVDAETLSAVNVDGSA